MGRTEKSQGLAPPAIRKDARAKQAKHIVNKVIPAILASNARARRGVEGSELVVDPLPVLLSGGVAKQVLHEEGGRLRDGVEGEDALYVKRKGQGKRRVKGRRDDDVVVREGHEQERDEGGKKKGKGKDKRRDSLDVEMASLSITPVLPPEEKEVRTKKRRIRIITTDTLTAAHMLSFPERYPGSSDDHAHGHHAKKNKHNTCILNMASPLRPGGGVLSGATSQEEFLCARTTLLPSLKDSFYRLPEIGGVYTNDVLVFRNCGPLSETSGNLGAGERYWVDVISAGMLRFPELEGQEEEVKVLEKKDREDVEKKMRGVLRIAAQKGVKKIVLGAWGCGAYGNPVGDIAQAWQKVLDGSSVTTKKGGTVGEGEDWGQIEDVVFAIANTKMARMFARAFGGGVEVESGPGGHGEEGEEEDAVGEELRAKIKEMEDQIAQVRGPDLKARMGTILEGLRAQLSSRNGEEGEDSSSQFTDAI